MSEHKYTGLEIAVVGMACKFPGANNVDEFWENLKNGKESVSTFTDEELRECNVPESELANDAYVRAKGIVEEAEYFDAEFFGLSPKEASQLDPQFRVLSQTAYHALEDAGHDFESTKNRVGVFVGGIPSVNWQMHCFDNTGGQFSERLPSLLFNDKDFMGTRLSYLLNLHGPSNTVYTACSTSLVSVDMACQSLLTGQSNLCVAGGVAISLPLKSGYTHQQGMIFSKDGHTSSFDSSATGTLWSDGAGVVVLKRLEDALNDGDNIHAIIKGSAINNDGNRKVGYTAPSVSGQVDVIKDALMVAEVPNESIGYIEGHGSATALGDKIEITALSEVFKGVDTNYNCPIGSVKSNLGHLNVAAGVAGLIKVCLMLKHAQIPPSINFKNPNSKLKEKDCSFFVNQELTNWENKEYPLRAGVSSFGIGGTNAHVILEKAPSQNKSSDDQRSAVICISAKTASGVDRRCEDLLAYATNNENINVSDLAFTLQTQRSHFEYRKTFVVRDREDLIKKLTQERAATKAEESEATVMMFPGMGGFYQGMAKDLYETESAFKEAIDECMAILKAKMGEDYTTVLTETGNEISGFQVPQLLVFSYEYALAKLLNAWGIHADTTLGYSLGEYVSACISGVFSLEDALEVLIERGRLMDIDKTGKMIGVPLSLEEIQSYLETGVSVAIDNGESVVLSGHKDQVETVKESLKNDNVLIHDILEGPAAHSPQMNPIKEEYKTALSNIVMYPPTLPMVANMTGDWCNEEFTTPEYWLNHLSETVYFNDALKKLVEKYPKATFLELGVGNFINILLRRLEQEDETLNLVNFARSNKQKSKDKTKATDHDYLMKAIASFWEFGGVVDWEKYHEENTRQKVSLPNYPFEKVSYNLNIEETVSQKPSTELTRNEDVSKWFYVPSWKKNPLTLNYDEVEETKRNILLFDIESSQDIVDRLSAYCNLVVVNYGAKFKKANDSTYYIDYNNKKQVLQVFESLEKDGFDLNTILDFTSILNDENRHSSLSRTVYIAQAIYNTNYAKAEIDYALITSNIFNVYGSESIDLKKSTLISAVKVIPQENTNIKCKLIEIEKDSYTRERGVFYDMLLDELNTKENIVSYRGFNRWCQTHDQYPIVPSKTNASKIKEGGTYVIVGGLGDVGYTIAGNIVKHHNANVIIVGRSKVPEKSEWKNWLKENGTDNSTAKKIERLQRLEKGKGNVYTMQSDSTSYEQMTELINTATSRFGEVNGIFYSAGDVVAMSLSLVNNVNDEQLHAHLPGKIKGLAVLQNIVADNAFDFALVISSASAILGGIGMIGYAAANQYVDSLVLNENAKGSRTKWMTLNYPYLNKEEATNQTENNVANESGEAAGRKRFEQFFSKNSHTGNTVINYEESRKIFGRILSKNNYESQIAISPVDFPTLIDRLQNPSDQVEETETKRKEGKKNRPVTDVDYVAPTNDVERKLAEIWEGVFGFKVGIEDDFFQLGGDSLGMIRLISSVQKTFDVAIEISEVFRDTSFKFQVDLINGGGKREDVAIQKAPEKEYYPQSEVQKSFFILNQMNPDLLCYNNLGVITLEGEVDVQEYENLFKDLIKTHDILRTSFHVVDGQSVQKIHKETDFKIQVFEDENESINDIIQRFHQPFDLEFPNLIRAAICKRKDGKFCVITDIHHIILDRVTFGLIVDDFQALQNKKEIAPSEIQYVDFSEWQQSGDFETLLEKQEEFWLNEFETMPDALTLPSDLPRTEVTNYNASSVIFELSDDKIDALFKISQKEKVTMYSLLLAMYYVLLSKLSNQEDIIVGTSVLGRQREDLQKVMGVFANALPIRTQMQPDETFKSFLAKVKNNAFQCFANQEYPFEKLVGKLGLAPDLNKNPLFDVMFEYYNFPEPKIDIPNATLVEMELPNITTEFDFCMRISAKDDGQHAFHIDYRNDLYNKETIERFAAYYRNIVDVIADNMEVKMTDLSVLPEAEQKLLVEDYNNTALPYKNEESLVALFEQQAKDKPNAKAVVHNGESLTYKELNERANQVARYLMSKGIVPGTMVGLLIDRSLDMVVGILGVLKAGGGYVPIDPELPEQRINYMLDKSRCSFLLANAQYMEQFTAYLPVQDINAKEIAIQSDTNLDIVLSADDLAYCIFTSGSSGQPKGVMMNQQSVVNLVAGLNEVVYKPYKNKDLNVALLASFSFDASIQQIFGGLLQGHTLFIVDDESRKDGIRLQKFYNQNAIDISDGTPTHLNFFVNAYNKEEQLTSLSSWILAGEALPKELVAKFQSKIGEGVQLYNFYGPTETCVDSTVFKIDWNTYQNYESIPIGKPLPNERVYVTDTNGNLVPIGVIGELCIAGDGLAQRYVGDIAMTSEKFDSDWIAWEDRVYRTGDLVKWLPDGNLAYYGRIDDQVKIRGYRIELGEIENVLAEHEAVADVAMLVENDDADGKSLVAYVVPNETKAQTVRKLIANNQEDPESNAELFEMENGISMYSANVSEIKMLYTEVFQHRTYHKNGIKVPKNATIIDIGANVGSFSVFSALTFENPKIYAFEPLAPTFDLLAKNAALYDENIEVFNIGIAEKEETAVFDYYPNATTISGRQTESYDIQGEVKRFLENTWEENEEQISNESKNELLENRLIKEQHECQLKSLSQVIQENEIGHIDLLKIDAENAEMDIVKGIKNEDWDKIDQVIIEVYDEDGRLEKIKNILNERNFEVAVFQSEELEGTKFYDVYCIKEKNIVEGKITKDFSSNWYGTNTFISSVREKLTESLPEYMIPSDFILIDKMPLTTSGKLDRKALAAIEKSQKSNKIDFTAPTNETEERLLEIWAEVLNLEKDKISITTDLFELGGHSLKMVLIVNKIRKEFDIKMTLKQLIANSTIQRLGKFLIKQDTTAHVAIVPVAEADYYPLSSSQKRLFFLSEFDNDAITYNQPQSFTLKGVFDEAKFSRIFEQIIARHESLRTSFKLLHGEPVQRIQKEVPFAVEYYEAKTEECDEIISEFVRPFDMEKAPLFRIGLIRIAADEHIMMFDMHHIISDGLSMEIFIKDLMTFYQDQELAPLTLQYKDYAVWQQSEAQQKQLQEHKDFWSAQFAETPEVLELPTNRLRPKVISYKGNLVEFELDENQTKGLNAVAKATGATLFSVLLSAYKVLLYKLTGQEDLVVGTSVAGRNHADIEQVMGVFINAVALRNTVEKDVSFKKLIAQINDNSLSCFEHQEYPYEALIDDLNLVRDTARNPLFDVMFEFVNFEQTAPEFTDLELIPYNFEYNVSKFDLTLHAADKTDHIAMDFQYATDLFDSETIDNFIAYFKSIINQLIANADTTIANVDVLNETQQQLIGTFSNADINFEATDNIVTTFEAAVEKHPTRTAIAFEGATLTYEELNTKSNQLANYLREQNIEKEDMIGLLLDRSLDMVVAILGVLKSGAAYLPIDPKLPQDRIAYMLEASNAKLVLGHANNIDKENPNCHEITSCFNEDLSTENITIERNASDLAYCIFTSGSTGLPKGVLMEHKGITNLVQGLGETVYKELGEGLHVGLLASYGFDASCQQIFGALLQGHTLFISNEEQRMDGLQLFNFYKENGIQVSDGTPTHFGMFLSSFSGAIDIPLQRWLLAGEALPKELVSDFYDRIHDESTLKLYNLYGPTESCVDSTYYSIDATQLENYISVPIGRPLPNERIHIVDTAGKPVPVGVEGELCIAGAGLARGYVNKDDEKGRFETNWIANETRVYRTGDLARWLPDGNIEYRGRKDSQVKLRGYRIELGEVEHTMLSHDAIIGGAVVIKTIEDEAYLTAYYVAENDIDQEQLRTQLLQTLPEYMVPSFFVRLDYLPVTANGKLDKKALPDPDTIGKDDFVAPSTENEQALQQIWAEVLKIDASAISVTQNFLELGGHSLKAIQIANMIKKNLGVEMKLAEIFQRTTIQEQAKFIDANQWLDEEELQETDKLEINI